MMVENDSKREANSRGHRAAKILLIAAVTIVSLLSVLRTILIASGFIIGFFLLGLSGACDFDCSNYPSGSFSTLIAATEIALPLILLFIPFKLYRARDFRGSLYTSMLLIPAVLLATFLGF